MRSAKSKVTFGQVLPSPVYFTLRQNGLACGDLNLGY